MSRGINKVILVGRIGNDPEVRSTQDGKTIARVSLATGEKWKDRNTGQDQVRTEWHRCIAFGPIADVIAQYLKKGSQVYFEGALGTNKYTDKNGVEKYATDIHISQLQMLGGGGNNNQSNFDQRPQNSYDGQQGRNQQQGFNQQNRATDNFNPNTADFDHFDDDVQF